MKLLDRPWQDIVFSLGEIIFLIALVPLLWTNSRISPYTGISTGLMLYVFCICQASYKNWITFFLTFAAGTVWILLAFGL